ncbi:DUF1534 domain-containing protein [Pseudomonas syringae pv. tomato]|nr:DUF1534 domain-containing protein [Pseudomonas syringae pv. tomato]
MRAFCWGFGRFSFQSGYLSFITFQSRNAVRDALRHKSAPRPPPSRSDAERRTIGYQQHDS